MNLLLDTGRIYGLGYEASTGETIKPLVLDCIAAWAKGNHKFNRFKGLTWFTDTEHSKLIAELNTRLNRPDLPIGLNILLYRGTERNTEIRFGQSLIDTLSHVCILDTNLVIIERPERWLSDLNHLHFQANPSDELLRIRRWCLARKATVVFLVPWQNRNNKPYWDKLLDGFGILYTPTQTIEYQYWFYGEMALQSPEYLKEPCDISLDIASSADVSNAVAKILSKKSSTFEIKLQTAIGHIDRFLWIQLGAKRTFDNLDPSSTLGANKHHRGTNEFTEKQFQKIIELVCPELIGSHPANHWIHLNRLSVARLKLFNAHIMIARLPLLDHISEKTVQDSFIAKPYGSTLTIVSDAAYIAFVTPNAKNENQIQTMLEAKFNRPIYELFSGEMYSRSDDIERTFARVWQDHLIVKKTRIPEQNLVIKRNIVETAISHNINNWNEAMQYWHRRWRKHAVKSQPALLAVRKEK